MTAVEKKLLQLLKAELSVYEELRRIKDQEREALMDFSPDSLDRCNQQQEQLIVRAERLEEERREVVFELAGGAEPGAKDPSLRAILPKLSEDVRRKAIDMGRRLSSVCVDLGNVQMSHTQLLTTSHRYLQEFIQRLLKKAQGVEAAYAPPGRIALRRELEPGLLDRRA